MMMMLLLLSLEGMGAMVVSFSLLLKEHNAGDRRIPVASFRELFPDVHNDRWQSWRRRCGIRKGAHKMSRFSALKLWILAGYQGGMSEAELRSAIADAIKKDPGKVELWLKGFEWNVGYRLGVSASAAVRTIMGVINNLAPQVEVIHRQRLYEWFKKAGMNFSSRASYGRAQIMRVVSIALRGVGRGRRRGEGHFF